MRRILFICVLVQILLGTLASKIYLTKHNTLHANGGWVSTKTELERGLMGSFAFVTERQSLAGGVLNLGAWHGFQEVVYKEPVSALESIEFDVRLSKGTDLVALFARDTEGAASGVRLGTVSRHPNALLRIAPDGEFLRRTPMAVRALEPDVWHRARIEFAADRIEVRVGDHKIGGFSFEQSAAGAFGFRGGGRKPILLDNIGVTLTNGDKVTEDFNAPRSVLGLAVLVSSALVALNLVLFFALARLTGSREPTLGFSFLMVNLTLLVIGAVVFVFVLLRAESYPGVGRALTQAEESFRRGTVEQVIADIRSLHEPRTAAGAGAGTDPYRVLFLGTSQTWGAGARQGSEIFVARFESLANARVTDGPPVECINAGFSSLRGADLVPILKEDLLPLRPGHMFINLSTNDRGTEGGFAASVRELAETALQAGVRVILIKEANEPGSMDQGQIARFAELEQVGTELDLTVIDMHGYLKRLQDRGFLWWDLVHLTSYGQRLMAEKLFHEFER